MTEASAPVPTVWIEETSWVDRIPRSVAMIAIFVVFIGLWQAVHGFEMVSRIILPSPWETAAQQWWWFPRS